MIAMLLNIARIVDGVVVNIEVADQDWLQQNTAENGEFQLVVYHDENPAHIGLGWSLESGFQQPEDEDQQLNDLLDSLLTDDHAAGS